MLLHGQTAEATFGTQTGERTLDKMTALATTTTTTTDDGWDAAAAENADRAIRGSLLKFSDGHWTKVGETTPLDGAHFAALGTAAAQVWWKDNKPIEYRFREPGKPLPERDELGDTDPAKWEKGPDGQPKDPWQSTRFVYLEDANGAIYTYTTASWGGRGAVADLGDQIQRVRFSRPGAVPVVELNSAPMRTKFGLKSKPFLKIVDWSDSNREQERPAPKLLTESNKVLDDSIPF